MPHVIPDQDPTWTSSPTPGATARPARRCSSPPSTAPASPAVAASRRRTTGSARCLHSLRTSGIPERRHPGFWDNDGRCCGTAGVGDVVLDAWQRHGRRRRPRLRVTLGDALVDRAIADGDHAYWRFVEHRNDDPLLPPGVGWMQGAAGIAAYLFRLARVLEQGRTPTAVARMDTWWALA